LSCTRSSLRIKPDSITRFLRAASSKKVEVDY
jgi:hypothetical protein